MMRIFCIFTNARTKRCRGIARLATRMVLGALLVDDAVALPIYYSRTGAPEWAGDQADRIYTCSAVGADGKTLADSEAKLATWFQNPESSLVPDRVEEVGDTASWIVTYGGERRVRFALRSRARFHNVSGPNQITLPERIADFRGKVGCRSFFHSCLLRFVVCVASIACRDKQKHKGFAWHHVCALSRGAQR